MFKLTPRDELYNTLNRPEAVLNKNLCLYYQPHPVFVAGDLCYMQNKHGREVLDCSWRKPASAIDDDFMSSWQTKKRVSVVSRRMKLIHVTFSCLCHISYLKFLEKSVVAHTLNIETVSVFIFCSCFPVCLLILVLLLL